MNHSKDFFQLDHGSERVNKHISNKHTGWLFRLTILQDIDLLIMKIKLILFQNLFKALFRSRINIIANIFVQKIGRKFHLV